MKPYGSKSQNFGDKLPKMGLNIIGLFWPTLVKGIAERNKCVPHLRKSFKGVLFVITDTVG